jgi:hypothetical protein
MENSESCSDNDSLALSAIYPIGGANQPIQLYDGIQEVTQGKVTEPGSGNLSFVWLPYPHFEFQLLQHDELCQDLRGKCFFRLPQFDAVAEAEIVKILHEIEESITNKISGRLLQSIVLESIQEISYVLFHISNFKMFIGSWISSQDSEIPRSWRGRVILEAEGWRVTIDAREEIFDIVDSLHSKSGYVVTHIGKLERSNREEFTAKEADEFLDALCYFLSFTRGLWSGLILPVGYNASENPVWIEWNPQRVKVDRWQDEEQQVYSWFWMNCSQSLAEIFPGFIRQWQDWSESLALVIHWYVESNKSVGGVQGSIILTQAALELLAWVLLVEKGRVSKDDFKKIKSTSRQIKCLLIEFNVPIEIPASLTNLVQFERNQPHSNNEGPYAFSAVRNLIIHSDPENRKRFRDTPSATIIEAWELGLWYVELILLRLFDYQGVYVNRLLRRRLIGGLEPVPWASMNS